MLFDNLPSSPLGIKINEFAEDIVKRPSKVKQLSVFDTRQDAAVNIVLSIKLDLFCEKKRGSGLNTTQSPDIDNTIHY